MRIYPLPDGAKLATFNKAGLVKLWEKLSPYDRLFADDNMRDPEVFLDQVLDPQTVCVEIDNGIIFLMRIVPTIRAEAHFAFWDHKLSSKTEILKQCLAWAFLTWEFERIETFVAWYAKAVRHFIEEKLNFQKEGVLRHRVRHQGKFIDMIAYSILRSEVF